MTDKIERLNRLDDDKLKDVVKNYRQYGYDENLRTAAISILEERGISKEDLQFSGNFVNRTYDFVDEIYSSFRQNSMIAFILYAVLIITNILVSALSIKYETIGSIALIVNWCALVLYLIFLLRSFINQSQFYKAIGMHYGSEGALLYLFIGMPLYIFMYFFFRNQMKEKMKEIK